MKAMRFHEYGDPQVLRLEEVNVPTPGEGQVRVRVAATSFNGVDGNIRAGRMQGPMPLDLPHTPGLDVAGTVDALGDGVDGLQVGDPVIGFLPFVDDGAAAEYVVAAAASLAPAPDEHPARRRGRTAPGRAHRLAGTLRARGPAGRAADPHQRRQRCRGRLRRAAGQVRRRPRHRHGERRHHATQVQAHGADEVVDHTAGDVSAGGQRAGRRVAQPGPDQSRAVHWPWPPWSATEGSSSTPPCGCPPRPTRRAACAASTCTSAATPTQLAELSRPRRPRRAHRRRRRARPDDRPRQRPHPRRRRNPRRQSRRPPVHRLTAPAR